METPSSLASRFRAEGKEGGRPVETVTSPTPARPLVAMDLRAALLMVEQYGLHDEIGYPDCGHEKSRVETRP